MFVNLISEIENKKEATPKTNLQAMIATTPS
jgi:hypothetical protein